MADVPGRALFASSERSLQRRAAEGPTREFLAFGLAGELYGIALRNVRQIVTPPPITFVPRAPRDVLGVCSVRGLLVTVIDLRLRMRVKAAPLGKKARILLSQSDDGEMLGLLVDEVRHVVRLTEDQVEVVSQAFGGDISDHVWGIGRTGGREVMVLIDQRSIVAGDR